MTRVSAFIDIKKFLESAAFVRTSMIATVCLGVVTLISCLARFGWPFEIATHFRAQCVFAALVLTLPYFVTRKLGIQVLAAALLLVVNATPVVQHFSKTYQSQNVALAGVDRHLVVTTSNLMTSKSALDKVVKLAEQKNSDILILTEMPLKSIPVLDKLSPLYPHTAVSGNRNGWDVAVLSRFPIVDKEMVRIGPIQTPILKVQLQLPGGKISVVAIHPPKPLTQETLKNRNLALKTAFGQLKAEPNSLIAGDMNATVWSPILWDLTSDLNSVFEVQPTWLMSLPFAGLSIDHLYATDALTVQRREVGPFVGSDHYPVTFYLRFAQPPEAAQAGSAFHGPAS